MEQRGVQVGDVVAVFHGVEAELVGRAVDDAALDAGPEEPDREPMRVVISLGVTGSVVFLLGSITPLNTKKPMRPTAMAAAIQYHFFPG